MLRFRESVHYLLAVKNIRILGNLLLIIVELIVSIRPGSLSQSAFCPTLIRVIVILKVILLNAVAFEDTLAILFPQVVTLFAHTAKK